MAPHSSLLLPALFFRYSLRLSLLPFACRTLLLLVTPGIGRKRVPRQHFLDPFFSLPPSLADPSPLGFYFLRTQRGCGPGTIVKTSLSTFDPSSLSSPSDPWLYHDFVVLSFCPRSLLIWTDVPQKRKNDLCALFVICALQFFKVFSFGLSCTLVETAAR